jgi:hypothetical protein
MNMFTRSRLNLPLSPAERSFLKLLQGIVASALVSGVVAVVPFLEQQTVNWHTVATVGVSAVAVTLYTAIQKYFTAQGDPIVLPTPVAAPVAPAPPASNI